MTKKISLADAIINTYGADNLHKALLDRTFEERKKIIRSLLKRDFPRTIPTWGGLANSVHAIDRKLKLS